MTEVLILGGTGWLSARIAARWVDAGAAVTCLARGARPAPDGALLLRGDRDDQHVYDELARRGWDEVVDVTSTAQHAERAIAALGERSGRWTYISSLSAYADDTVEGADESAPLHAAAQPGDAYEYGAQKSAAEAAVRRLGVRGRIIRPGLIVGPGDPSDRFGYWAAAFDRAEGAPVLVPWLADQRVQVIDVDDLAHFAATASVTGAVNAIGDTHAMADVLALFQAAVGHTGEIVEAADDWLRARDVQYWAGERSLPLWLPADMPGFATRSHALYSARGGRISPLAETIRRVVDDERIRGVSRPRRAGLTREDERALLAELA